MIWFKIGGNMDLPKVIHDTGDIRYRAPFGAVQRGSEVHLSIRIESGTPQWVQLRFWKEKSGEKIKEAVPSGKGDGFWHSTVTLNTPGVYWYYFIICIDGNVFYYSRKNNTDFGEGFLSSDPMHSFQLTVYEHFTVPKWYSESVMYQIFPDRFHRVLDQIPEHYDEMYDQIKINNRVFLINKKAEDVPSYRRDPSTGFLTNDDYFGGNLRGIIEKLDYLQSLGISTVYLNPIFEAFSNHRYNTGDYLKIDPLLGDMETFKELCREGKKRGISFILDGVFSHTGSDSIYFNKDGRYPDLGAYQSKDSNYHPWYCFKSFPDEYDCWWGIDTLPNVNETEPSFMDFIIRNKDGVIRYWIENGAKGWRLDVADELPGVFIKEIRTALKDQDPEAVLIGEVWEDASNKVSYGALRTYLLGQELDTVMNYPFRSLVLDYMTGKISGRHFSLSTMALYQNYPKQAFFACMNLLGTHDVPRVRTILGDAPSENGLDFDERSKYRLNEYQRVLADQRQKAAVVIQMTYPGVPVVYYGDEAGMEGYTDPFNRGAFPWGHEDKSMIQWYRQWITLRNEMDALRRGEYIPFTGLKIDMDHKGREDIFGFIRIIQNNTDVFGQKAQNGLVLVLVNRSVEKEHTVLIDLGDYRIQNLKCVTEESGQYNLDGNALTVTLSPVDCAVWCDS